MKNKARDVSTHVFSAADQILPDANVWLYLYSPATVAYPQWLKNEIAPYSKAWKSLHGQGAKAFLDTMVLSEVINRLLDEEWLRLDPPDRFTKARRYRKRKDFRCSADYSPAAKSVEALGRQILADAQPIDHPFSKWDLNVLLTDFGSGSTDWNDQLIVENCRLHGLKLLTHDKDYTYGGIQVLTANGKLLAACPP
jgi:predicted nucleic acid-binding protein